MELVEETTETAAPELKEAAVDPLDNPEVNKAAYDFSNLMPRIRGLAKNMGGKGLARVYNAIVEFPFNSTTPKFRNAAENELFVLTLHAQGLKSVMSAAVQAHHQEIEHLATQGIVEELKAEREANNE